MLVLTRKPGEQVIIGSGITITVVDLTRGRVRIGIDAPIQVSIRRAELPEAPDRSAGGADRAETMLAEGQSNVRPQMDQAEG
jgi:carbon storage regulator